MAKLVEISLYKSDPHYPWGFTVGSTSSNPSVSITSVLDGALSSAQLEVGDRVLEIDGVDTGILSHREIDLLFQRSSTRITLLILKKNKKKEVRVERETWEELRHPDVGFWDNDYLERNESNAGRFAGRVDKQELWNSRESPTKMQPLARSPSLEFKGYREESFPARERARSCDPPPEERLPKSPAVHKIHSSNPFLYDNHRERWRQGDGVAPKGREEKRAAKEIIGEHLRRRPDWRRHNSVPSAQLKKPSDFLSTRSMSCEEKTQAVGVPPRPHRDQSKPEDVNFEKSGQKFSHTFTGPKRSGRIRRMAEKLFKLPSAEDVRLPPRGQLRDSDEYSRRRREEGAECAAHDKIKPCEPHLPPSVPNNKFLSRESLRNEDVKLEDKMTEFETSKRAASSSTESRIGKSGQGLPHNEPVLSENDKVHPIFCHSGENKCNSMHPTDTGSNFRHDEIKSTANSLLNPPNDFGNNKANINTRKKNTRTTCDGTEFPIDYAKEKEIRSEMYMHETNKTRSEKVSFVEKPSAGTVETEEYSAENVAGEKSFCSRVEHNFLDARKVPGGPRATSSANTRQVGYKLSDWEGDTGSYNPHAYKERKWENSNSRDGGRSWERRGDRFGYERDEFGRNSYENRQNGEGAGGSKHRQLPQAGSASDNRQIVTTTPRPRDVTHAVQPGRPQPTRTLATRYYDVDHKKKKGSVEARSDDAKQLYGSEPIEGFDRQTAKESDYHYYYPASTSKNTPSRARTSGTEYCAPISYQRFTNFSEQKDSNSPSELLHRDGNTSRGNTDWWRDKANLSKPNGTDLGRSYKFLDVDFNKNTTQYAKNGPIRAISSGPAVDTDRLHVQPEFRQLANTKLSDLGIYQSASLPPTVDAYEQYSYNEPCENVGSIDEQINFNSELSFRNPSAIGKDAFDIDSEENGGRESDLIEFKSIPVSQEIYNVIQNIPAPISKSTPNVVEEPFKDYVQDTDVKDSQIRPNSDRPTLDEEQLKINTGQNRKTSENLTVESNLTESGIFSKSTESNNNFPIKDRFEGDGDEKRGESPGERSFSKASEESFATPAWDESSWKASQSSSVGRFVSAEQLDHQPSCELKTCLASSEKNLTCETILKWADEIMAEEETRRNTEEEHYESRSETVVKDNGETAKKEIKERFSEISDNTNCTTQFSEGVRSEKHVASRTYMDYDRVSTESNLSPGQQPSKSAIEETIVVTKKSDHKEESEEMSSTRWGGESIKSWNERKNDSKSIRKEHIINEAGGYQESVPNPHPFANCRPQDSNTNGEHGPAKILKEEFREKKFTSEEKHWSILREATTAPADCRPSADGKQQERSTNKERTEEDIKHYGFGPGQGPYEAEWEDGKYSINATKEQNVSERMNAQTNEELMSPKFDIVKDSSRPREEYCYKISGERVGAHSDRLADVSKEARSNRHETTDSSVKAESARETIKEKFSNLPCDQISERITSVNVTQINETDRLERVQSLSTSSVKEDATKISRNTEDGDKHESSSVHRERSDDREDMFSVRSEETAMGRCAERGGETPPGHGAAGGVAIERQRTTSALSNIRGQEGANIKADGSGDRDDCRSGGILSDRADDTPPGFYDNHPSPPPQPKTFQELQSRLRSLLSGNDSLRHGSIVRARQSSQISQGGGGNSPGGPVSPPGGNGNSAPLPPPPPPMAPSGGIPPVRIQSEIGPKKFSEPPAAIQNAMMTKDKKPFTYTPGGLDLTEIRSPRMARRINRNAHVQDSCSGPPPPKTSPLVQQPPGPLPPAVIAAMQPQLPIQVFPSGVPPPPPIPDSSGKTSVRAPPPPPMPDQSIRPSEGVLPPPFIEDNGSKTSVGAPPPPPMPDQSNKAPCHTLRPDLVSELQRQPSLRPVGPPQSRPDFVAEIPNHAPLRPVNFGARFSQPQEPAQIPQPPLKNVQSQPKPPQEASTVKTQEPDLSQEEFPKYQLPKLAETAPVQVRPAIHTTPNNANVSMPPTPPTPPTGNLNKSPAPWMNSGQKQMSKEVPAWATLNRAPSREESAVKESQPSFTATQQTPQSSFSTSQQTPQTSFTAPQQPSQTRIIPIQIEGREPPKQQVASPQNNHQPIKLEGQSQSQGRTRIIPIQMEGAGESTSPRQPVHRQASLPAGVRGPPNFSPNKFNQTPSPYPNSQMPMDTNDGRGRQQLQSQQSWSQPNNGTPIQSRSFRVLQKMTGSDEQAQGSLLPGQAFLMNRVYPRQEEIPAHQYLGGDMSGRPPQNMSSGQDNTGRPGESEY